MYTRRRFGVCTGGVFSVSHNTPQHTTTTRPHNHKTTQHKHTTQQQQPAASSQQPATSNQQPTTNKPTNQQTSNQQPTNQQTNKPTNQQTNQPTNTPTHQPTNTPTHQPTPVSIQEALKIPEAEAAPWINNEKKSKQVPAWNVKKVRSKSEVIRQELCSGRTTSKTKKDTEQCSQSKVLQCLRWQRQSSWTVSHTFLVGLGK